MLVCVNKAYFKRLLRVNWAYRVSGRDLEVRLNARPRFADIMCRSLTRGGSKLKADLSLTRKVTAVLIRNLSTRWRWWSASHPSRLLLGICSVLGQYFLYFDVTFCIKWVALQIVLKFIFKHTAISVCLWPRHCASSGCGWRNGLQYGGYLRIYWISSRGQPTRSGPSAWELGEVLTIPHGKNVSSYEIFTREAPDPDFYDRDRWQALVNAAMNRKMRGISWLA